MVVRVVFAVALNAASSQTLALVNAALRACEHRNGEEHTQALFFIRYRKYDSTTSRIAVHDTLQVDQLLGRDLVDDEAAVAAQHILATEAQWAMCMRRTTASSVQLMHMVGLRATRL